MLRVWVWLKGKIPSDLRRGDVSSACSPGVLKANYYLIISSLIKRKAACLLEVTLAWSEAWEVQSEGAKGAPSPWGSPWLGRPSHMSLPEVAQPLWAWNTLALEIRAPKPCFACLCLQGIWLYAFFRALVCTPCPFRRVLAPSHGHTNVLAGPIWGQRSGGCHTPQGGSPSSSHCLLLLFSWANWF